MAAPDEHRIRFSTNVADTLQWAKRHGYRTAITGERIGPDAVALLLQRDTELIIVNVPATLHWDGERITVES
ncbi:hypothetical protein [Streptomyces venezuelae]|uniref:Uncharacterized protein n=1 Tax=Streptomyces venezuelae TaxID=54571 RepID=A0A5P2B5I5_STRVZ|nr:hypothetical protein [Streptomyces venezuelae]QES25832.1 hypothetical protein DEJ47_04630 [Streptomyces venezuelae]